MADDVLIDNGDGADFTVSADDAAGKYVQRVKLAYSADGSATHVPADADGLLVNLGANNDVTVTGTVTAQDGGGSLTVDAASLPLPTGAATETTLAGVETDTGGILAELQGGIAATVTGSVTADTELATADLDTGAGTDTHAVVGLVLPGSGGAQLVGGSTRVPVDGSGVTQPVSGPLTDAQLRASAVSVADGGSTLSVDDGGGSLTVDGTVALGAGAASIGTLGANSGTDIGDVTVNNGAGAAAVPIQDGGNSITVDGTVTANAGSGPWPVTDNGGSLTVDGTVGVSGTVAVDSELTSHDLDSGAGTVNGAGAAVLVPGAGGPVVVTGDASNGLDVDVTRVSGNVTVVDGGGSLTVDGTVTVQDGGGAISVDDNGGSLTVDGSVSLAAAIPAGTNNIGDVDVLSLPSLPAGTNAIGKLAANSGVDIGDVDVTSIAAGTNTIGDVGVKPRTSGGLTIFRSLDLDETEEDVKTSAGQLFGWYLYNNSTSTRYVKIYNATAANVTVGTTTPVLTIPVPPGSAANSFSEIGVAFSTAICAAATTGVADNDTGAPSANDVVANFFYA